MEDMENNNTQLTDLKNELSKLVDECETLYDTYDDRRAKVSFSLFFCCTAEDLCLTCHSYFTGYSD